MPYRSCIVAIAFWAFASLAWAGQPLTLEQSKQITKDVDAQSVGNAIKKPTDAAPVQTTTPKATDQLATSAVQVNTTRLPVRFADKSQLSLYQSRDKAVWDPLKAQLVVDGLDPVVLDVLFANIQNDYSPAYMALKAIELYGLRYKGSASLNLSLEEATSFSPPNYQAMAGSMSTSACRNFMKRNEKLLGGIYKSYGVPPSVITSILLVETGIGGNLGTQSAFRVLAGMAVTDSLDVVRPVIKGLTLNSKQEDELDKEIQNKAAWARNELVALINYGLSNNLDIPNIPGSIYGAIGLCQFMPSNIPIYGADADGDKKVDLFKLSDAAYSVGKYLSAHGWKKAQTPKAQLAVLRSYNHSDTYAALVYGVSMQLISPTTFSATQAATQGGNTVSAVRKTVNAHMPGKKAKDMEKLPAYDNLLSK